MQYGVGWTVAVDPPSRAADVMHYMMTGHQLCGRSLDGVVIRDVTDAKYERLAKRRLRDLARSMQAAGLVAPPPVEEPVFGFRKRWVILTIEEAKR